MNKILSIYIREQTPYSKIALRNLLSLNEEEFRILVKKLKGYGILKVINYSSEQKDLSDLINYIPENIEDNGEYRYVFKFVGVLTIDHIIIKCFPKYLVNKESPLQEMKQVLKVLQKYSSKEQIINLLNGDESQKSYNLLSIILFLINDYYENGEYINYQEIIETNGECEILWDNTINETIPIINNACPFYLDLKTRNVLNDEMDYFTRLHKWIITDCCKKMNQGDLLEIFEIDNIVISDEELLDFGDIEYILYKLSRELNEQFITRKQNILKAISAYLSHTSLGNNNLGMSMYGTTSFNLVWENVCATVFDNKLSTPIEKLELPINLHPDYKDRKEQTLLEIIKKPTWRYFNSNHESYDNVARDTLTPDTISIFSVKNDLCFGIFDAKYYSLKLGIEELSSYPGVADITKQYLYQLAYSDFIIKNRFKYIVNAFLMPTDSDELIINGEVEMEILKGLSMPGLINILILKLPANKIYQHYLQHKKIDVCNEYPNLPHYCTKIEF